MNEEINEAVETEGAEGWADSDAFWDDDPAAETEPAAEQEEAEDAEADEQEAEETDTADDPHDEGADDGAEEPEGQQGESADQRFELKHLEETRSVDREEVIKLAQKGMDYDRIREERDSIRPELRLYREFLKELADGSGLTVSELIDTVRAQRLVAKEKENGKEMTEAEALIKVQRERSEKAKSAPKAEEEAPPEEEKPAEAKAEDSRKESFARFAREFPDVKAEDIPAKVWQDFSAGKGDLADIYARHENTALKAKIAAMERNEDNRKRSTGSRKSSGAKAKDIFDSAWEDSPYD